MKNNLGLNLIYRQITRMGELGQENAYQVLYFFSDIGHISENTMNKVYAEFPKFIDIQGDYYFKTLEDLGRFAGLMCAELEAPEVFILSVQDYNLGLEATSDLRGFRDIFRRYGSVVENPELKDKKKNLFSKILGS